MCWEGGTDSKTEDWLLHHEGFKEEDRVNRDEKAIKEKMAENVPNFEKEQIT